MRWFSRLSGTARVMLVSLGAWMVVFFCLGVAVSLLVYPFERPLPFGVGLVLGHLLSAMKLVLMDRSIDRTLEMESGRAKNYAGLQATLRYFLTIAFLVGAVLLPGYIGIIGVVLGILSLQLSAYTANAVLKKRSDLL